MREEGRGKREEEEGREKKVFVCLCVRCDVANFCYVSVCVCMYVCDENVC